MKGESTAVTWRTYEPCRFLGAASRGAGTTGLGPQVWAGAQDSACAISSVPTPNCKVILMSVVCGPHLEKRCMSPLTKRAHRH